MKRPTVRSMLTGFRPEVSGAYARVRHPRRRRSRVRELQPQMAQALRLLRAAGRLGTPGALPGPPELLPMGARVLAQGYLNRFSMPVLNGWLLPRWMREQSSPASPTFTPRSVLNLMANQTARNWTALGIPGADHPVESIVDRWGLLTPIPGGPSLDWWVDVEGSETGRMAPSMQREVLQSLQGGLPVVLTAYEAEGLRVSSEAWALPAQDGDWAAMQVVLFNIADMVLRGSFYFALRPYNPEGISPIYTIACDGSALKAGGRPPIFTWPAPDNCAVSGLRAGDLFGAMDDGRKTEGEPGHETPITHRSSPHAALLNDPHGFAHGVLRYDFRIEPWEEAEFLAFTRIHLPRKRRRVRHKPIFGDSGVVLSGSGAITDPNGSIISHTSSLSLNPKHYSRVKAATTLQWRALLDSGMTVAVPHRELQSSWEANRAHLLALHDGDEITPGPDIYHSFWFRDATYMAYALSICGYAEAAEQLLRGFIKRQRREGAFVSHSGEWDSTGQALWAISRHLSLHPDGTLLAEVRPAITRAARWIAHTLAKAPSGLMPPGISSEHFGPPDRYYWDNLWSLAGLEAVEALIGEGRRTKDERRTEAIVALRRSLSEAWEKDAASLGVEAIPAAPGKNIDLGTVGSLVAWFPLGLLDAHDPLLEGTLAALERATFHDGALFVNTGHSGWSSYLNMRVAGCRLLQGSPKGWEIMKWLLRHASPTYNWPEAIHPHSGGGSAGDGHHGWASAEWLMLVRAMLLREGLDTLRITPALPEEWLASAGQITVRDAPTTFGPLSFDVAWDDGGRTLNLQLDGRWRNPPRTMVWHIPGKSATLLPDAKSHTLTRSV